MGSRKGMRAQEEQARQDHELSGAGAGFREQRSPREPDDGRRSIEDPLQDDDSRSAIAPRRSRESDDIEAFEDDTDDSVDDENDLA